MRSAAFLLLAACALEGESDCEIGAYRCTDEVLEECVEVEGWVTAEDCGEEGLVCIDGEDHCDSFRETSR